MPSKKSARKPRIKSATVQFGNKIFKEFLYEDKHRVLWNAADGRRIPLSELGDNHLFKILQLIEANLNLYGSSYPTSKLPPGHMEQYDALVKEALRRELFTWAPERKYLARISERIRNRP